MYMYDTNRGTSLILPPLGNGETGPIGGWRLVRGIRDKIIYMVLF